MKKYRIKFENDVYTSNQENYAKRCGLSREHVNKILRGKATTTHSTALLLIIMDDMRTHKLVDHYYERLFINFEIIDDEE